MAKRLKKEKVNVDIINFGEEVNLKLQTLLHAVGPVWTSGSFWTILSSAGDEHREADGFHQHT